MKSITHFEGGYEFVGSVDMADIDEGEMPVCVYRKIPTPLIKSAVSSISQ